ncbi:multicopper oxidase family protein [Amnibacterium sp.]|uniref:multicopper oxidase family protein n=1 Tax=Amnibacterium sp. TaxID=1872496 RepID=UPI003F7BC636
MSPVTRREALLLGGIGSASVAAGVTGLILTAPGGAGAPGPVRSGVDFVQPPVRTASRGLLDVDLTAAETSTVIAGRSATVWAFEGGVPGPTLRVRAGDRLRVRLRNRLSEPTNLHVHGLHVAPGGNSDNVFISVEPGGDFQYEYRLPADHAPGTFWYHPHHHGSVADQVFAGLYGAIVVEDPVPVPAARERVLVISDITIGPDGHPAPASASERILGREGSSVLVNGQVTPHLTARPGERERWRIVNACAARVLRLRLDGQRLQLLAIDAGRSTGPTDVSEVVLSPGNRADLLVTAQSGTNSLWTLPVDRGGTGGMMGAGAQPNQQTVHLATLTVDGRPVAAASPIPSSPPARDLRTAAVTAKRQLTFAMGMGGMSGMSLTIDGRAFDPSRVDTRVRMGAVEEWTLVNASPMDHPFHLHVWPMQVLTDGASPVWRDVVNVPAHGSVRVRIAFQDFPGRTVYHCHILDHEDAGMMGVVLGA